MADVVDHQGNQLLGKLIGTVVVGTIRHQSWHTIGVVEGADEMIARCLRC